LHNLTRGPLNVNFPNFVTIGHYNNNKDEVEWRKKKGHKLSTILVWDSEHEFGIKSISNPKLRANFFCSISPKFQYGKNERKKHHSNGVM
jgi:hypothetical protein